MNWRCLIYGHEPKDSKDNWILWICGRCEHKEFVALV